MYQASPHPPLSLQHPNPGQTKLEATKMKLRNTLAVAATLMVVAVSIAAIQSVRVEARLTGPGDNKGKAKWVARSGREAQLQIEGENLAPNTDHVVVIGNNAPWFGTTNGFGDLRIVQLYRGANRPNINAGDAVEVTDEAGEVVLTGAMEPR